jgi:hypothetical protein
MSEKEEKTGEDSLWPVRLSYQTTSQSGRSGHATPVRDRLDSPSTLSLHLTAPPPSNNPHRIIITMDSPNSDLSELSSDDFSEEVKGRRNSFEDTPDHEPSGRPSKRPRLNLRAMSDPPASPHSMEADGAISEDTDGSVPASPHHPGMSADDDYGHEQVTVCKWDGCDAGDLGNMDKLVEHLHDDHIGTRQKKYSCEWSDCSRKGIPHASGYALRAHMRSHTREKPFYCTLPGTKSP